MMNLPPITALAPTKGLILSIISVGQLSSPTNRQKVLYGPPWGNVILGGPLGLGVPDKKQRVKNKLNIKNAPIKVKLCTKN